MHIPAERRTDEAIATFGLLDHTPPATIEGDAARLSSTDDACLRLAMLSGREADLGDAERLAEAHAGTLLRLLAHRDDAWLREHMRDLGQLLTERRAAAIS